jgi:choline dehydrogenase-like flavoprotein
MTTPNTQRQHRPGHPHPGPAATAAAAGFLSRDDYEAVVVGSGFGGAVAACRLAQAGVDVAVVERGRRFPPGSFPRDLGRLDSGWLWALGHGLYDIRVYGDILCIQAAGYGGGSLVYANVVIRPPAEVFEQAWPRPYGGPSSTRTTTWPPTCSPSSRFSPTRRPDRCPPRRC